MKIKPLLFFLVLLNACNPAQNSHAPNPNPVAASAATNDNPSVPIKADLPIDLDGVASLLHPIVVSAVEEYAEKSYSYSGSERKIYSHLDVGHYQVSGKMFNLVLENKQTGESKPLFPKNNQLIHRAEYVIHLVHDNATAKTEKRKLYRHFVYEIQEHLDEKAPFSKERALYLSDEYGDNRQKLHSDKEFLLHTRWLPEMERYYFTTKSDSDGDGKITLHDQVHNYYVDFKENQPIVKAYDVLPK